MLGDLIYFEGVADFFDLCFYLFCALQGIFTLRTKDYLNILSRENIF